MGLGNVPNITQPVSGWGRIEAQSLCSFSHTNPLFGEEAAVCKNTHSHLLSGIQWAWWGTGFTSNDSNWSPSVSLSISPHKDFMKITKFINCFDLLENKTQDKLLDDHGFDPAARHPLSAWSPRSYYRVSRWFLSLYSSRLACFLLKKPRGRQRNGKQSFLSQKKALPTGCKSQNLWGFFLPLLSSPAPKVLLPVDHPLPLLNSILNPIIQDIIMSDLEAD